MAAETLPFRYLAVDGPIGVGKTVLVDKLVRRFEAVKVLVGLLAKRFSGTQILEDVTNPFLADFYAGKKGAAFQTQMYFLLSRYKQQHEVVQQELFQRLVISDYTFQKDRIFAYLTLSDEELAIYDRLYTTLEPQVPVPDLVLYLTADVDTCMTRIRKRARSFEKEISDEYMLELIDAYNHYFHYYNRSPLLVVDTRNLDFPGSKSDFEELVQQLLRPIRGTEYFVPARKR